MEKVNVHTPSDINKIKSNLSEMLSIANIEFDEFFAGHTLERPIEGIVISTKFRVKFTSEEERDKIFNLLGAISEGFTE